MRLQGNAFRGTTGGTRCEGTEIRLLAPSAGNLNVQSTCRVSRRFNSALEPDAPGEARNHGDWGRKSLRQASAKSNVRTTPELWGSMGHPSGDQRDDNSFVAFPSRECASGPGICVSRQIFLPVLVGASPEVPGARKIAASVHGTFAARRRYDCACGYSSTAPESIAKHVTILNLGRGPLASCNQKRAKNR